MKWGYKHPGKKIVQKRSPWLSRHQEGHLSFSMDDGFKGGRVQLSGCLEDSQIPLCSTLQNFLRLPSLSCWVSALFRAQETLKFQAPVLRAIVTLEGRPSSIPTRQTHLEGYVGRQESFQWAWDNQQPRRAIWEQLLMKMWRQDTVEGFM